MRAAKSCEAQLRNTRSNNPISYGHAMRLARTRRNDLISAPVTVLRSGIVANRNLTLHPAQHSSTDRRRDVTTASILGLGRNEVPAGEKMVVLITGCSAGGIGNSLCKALAERGCTVVATARKPEAMEDLRDKVASRLQLDVTDRDSINKAVNQVLKEHGQIDMVVNNAGTAAAAMSVVAARLENWREVYDVNIFGLVSVIQAVAPHMISRRKGRIINIGSTAAFNCLPFAAPYCSSKAAVHSLSQALRLELRPFGIETMIVAPGFIRSRFAWNARGDVTEYDKQLYGEEPVVMNNMHFLNAATTKSYATNSEVLASSLADTAVQRDPLPSEWSEGRGAWSLKFATRFLPSSLIDWSDSLFTGLTKMETREKAKAARRGR